MCDKSRVPAWKAGRKKAYEKAKRRKNMTSQDGRSEKQVEKNIWKSKKAKKYDKWRRPGGKASRKKHMKKQKGEKIWQVKAAGVKSK